ncbi:beta-1,3-galactosyltransferase 1-like [Penaeus chinensis]|uniref:beta-1,3-galactosyltransferase 1-like n=1 Tax=Penaeus chinensis TaxID=139456 RepID=UPI001FB625C7|nr:beta-1,3-galactosyltransferase 1-like [Penaeus chinensis]
MLINVFPNLSRRLRLSRVLPLAFIAVCLGFYLTDGTTRIFSRTSYSTKVPLQCAAYDNKGRDIEGIKELNTTNRTAVLDAESKSEDESWMNDTGKTLVRDSRQFPFKYSLNEPDACAGGVDIINFIFVSPDDRLTRLHIRNKWGNATFFPYTRMKTMYVIASADSEATQKYLQRESDAFHDIIQLDFFDSYENLTLKTLAILHWTKTFCSNAKWVFKSDTDVFVNSFAVAKYLRHNLSDFVCSVCKRCPVCRKGMDCLEKWWVSEQEYANEYYPPYCHGSAYIIRTDTAIKIYERANKTHPLVIEDAYFTGVLTDDMDVTYTDLSRKLFIRTTSRLPRDFVQGSSLMALHIDTFSRRSPKLWRLIVEYNTGLH